jgi:hypothetical protein
VTDLVDRVRDEIGARLRELRPAVEEHRQLEEVQKALAKSRRGGRPPASPRRGRRAKGRGGATRKRATREQAKRRRQQVLAVLSEDPGTRPSALAGMLDVSNQNMYRLLRRLQSEKAIKKTKKGYEVRDGAAAAS